MIVTVIEANSEKKNKVKKRKEAKISKKTSIKSTEYVMKLKNMRDTIIN